MDYFKRLIDFFTMGSARPIRRLATYYVVLALVGLALFHFFPILDGLLSGERLERLVKTPLSLQDGLTTARRRRRSRGSRRASSSPSAPRSSFSARSR